MSLMDPDIIYQMALSGIPNLGPVKQSGLIDFFSSAKKVFSAGYKELLETGLLNEHEAALIKAVERFDGYTAQIKVLRDSHIRVLSYKDMLYPARLRQIASFPILLYYRGAIDLLNQKNILAVVGSRHMTDYGRNVLRDFIPALTDQGVVIVSGMAFGVDVTAHILCLDAKGKTVAVQAQGVEKGHPAAHAGVFQRIMDNGGCVISEFPFIENGAVEKFHFPRRNRLISGMSDAVLVVEAAEKSGALITARYAIEQNRDCFAVPGSIYQNTSRGCLNLIKDGAGVACAVQDILEGLGLVKRSHEKQEELPFTETRVATDHLETPLERQILVCCKDRPVSMDELVDMVREPASFVTATITKMQLMGKLKEVEGKKFAAV
ncbi:MAG: DNA-protecting protein DprA [Deltaproteobacteria bacterium]|nr:DNA-protecting protein DprA [Deltaproteobacteria bacterium]